MHPTVKVFMIAWVSFFAFTSVAMFVFVTSGRGGVEGNPSLVLLIPAGMAVAGVAMAKFGPWLGRSKERAIVEFINIRGR